MNIETTGWASYCPEDNKLRLYVGRVPRPEYDFLRAQGWTATPKQDCDFVATWTPQREDTALAYSPDGIEDEDKSPADRAADRAERFAGYADKRMGEAVTRADSYEAGPAVHGYQSQALAERRAAAHDRQGTRAVNLWGKAEYWQQRTAGVIGHALHVSAPGVRMGRILEIEAELRKFEKNLAEYKASWELWQKVAAEADPVKAFALATLAAGSCHSYGYKHPRPDESISGYVQENGTSLWSLLTHEANPITGAEAAALWLEGCKAPDDPASSSNRWIAHLKLRLAYEHQMLEAQGGRAAFVEMEAGGWIGKHQIQKVNKSPETGRVVSVRVRMPSREEFGRTVDRLLTVERLASDVYRAPTEEERMAFAENKRAAKKERATAPKGPQLINPTMEDAEKLQAVWNGVRKSYQSEVQTVKPMTQAEYSTGLMAGYCKTRDITGGGFMDQTRFNRADFPTVAKVRSCGYRVVVITDKPQKALGAEVWYDPRPAVRAEVIERIAEVVEASRVPYSDKRTAAQNEIWGKACMVGLASEVSWSQHHLSAEAHEIARAAGVYGDAWKVGVQ